MTAFLTGCADELARPTLAPAMTETLIGIEIGGTKLQVVLGDAAGAIHRRFRFAVDRARGAEGIREQIARALAEPEARDARAVGAGFGGPVDWRTGRVCCSHHVAGWSDFPLGDWLRELTGRPAAVDNDANVAALAEARLGAGRGADPVLYVTLGSGVGGGLVCGGAIYHGAPPGEVELGHVRLDRAGATVESRCAGWAVDRKVRARIAARRPAGPAGGHGHRRRGAASGTGAGRGRCRGPGDSGGNRGGPRLRPLARGAFAASRRHRVGGRVVAAG